MCDTRRCLASPVGARLGATSAGGIGAAWLTLSETRVIFSALAPSRHRPLCDSDCGRAYVATLPSFPAAAFAPVLLLR